MDPFSKKIIRKARWKVDDAQLNTYFTRSNNLKLMDNSIHSMNSSESRAYILKVFKGKKMGVAYSNHPDPKLLDRAVKMVKVANNLDYFYGLPDKSKPKNVDIYNEQIAGRGVDYYINYGDKIIDNLKSKNTKLENSDVVGTETTFTVANSNGIDMMQEDTKFSVSASISHKSGTKVRNHWDFKSERKIINATEFCNKLKTMAETSAKSKLLKNDVKTVILSPRVLYYLSEYALLPSFLGTNIENRHSILTKKLGEKVFSDKLTLINDGTISGGFRSEQFDYEGTPTKKTTLVEQGVVKNFLFDYNTGHFLGKESTGSAAKVGVTFNNVVLDVPTTKDIFAGVDKGVYITSVMGAHNSDPITTGFSVEADKGFYIENGEIKNPITGANFTSSMAHLMENIQSMGKQESIAGFYTGPVKFNNALVKKN